MNARRRWQVRGRNSALSGRCLGYTRVNGRAPDDGRPRRLVLRRRGDLRPDRLQMDGPHRPRPLRGPAPFHPARARLSPDQPANPLRAAPHAGRGGDRPAEELPRVAAPGRVRADPEGARPAADHRGDEQVRPLLADRRRPARARRPGPRHGHRLTAGGDRSLLPSKLTTPAVPGTLVLPMARTTSTGIPASMRMFVVAISILPL